MKLLTEYVSITDLQVLTEASDENKSEKKIRVYGPFMEANVTNKNLRQYPRSVMESALSVYQTEYIDRKRSCGTLDHENDNPSVSLDRISHIVEDLHFKDENDHKCYGTARILSDLPCGKIFATLIREGILCGFSSRAIGELDDKRTVTSMTLLSLDAVISPSAPTAYISNVVEECRDWSIDGQGNIVEMAVNNLKIKSDKKYTSKLALQYMMEFIEDIQNKK